MYFLPSTGEMPSSFWDKHRRRMKMSSLRYYIYEAVSTVPVNGNIDRFSVAVSSVRLVSLQEEIARGLRLMRLEEPLFVTSDRNLARRLADCEI